MSNQSSWSEAHDILRYMEFCLGAPWRSGFAGASRGCVRLPRSVVAVGRRGKVVSFGRPGRKTATGRQHCFGHEIHFSSCLPVESLAWSIVEMDDDFLLLPCAFVINFGVIFFIFKAKIFMKWSTSSSSFCCFLMSLIISNLSLALSSKIFSQPWSNTTYPSSSISYTFVRYRSPELALLHRLNFFSP